MEQDYDDLGYRDIDWIAVEKLDVKRAQSNAGGAQSHMDVDDASQNPQSRGGARPQGGNGGGGK